MNTLPIKPNIKITIFGEEHDPSKEFELNASDKNLQSPKRSFSKEIIAPYGLSAIVIFKKFNFAKGMADPKHNYKENSYEVMHNLNEIHYMHDKLFNEIPCAFESWTTGRNMFYFGERAKEMHITKSPKWFGKEKEYTDYEYCNHPPITEFIHPSWTGYLPPYAAQPTNA
tara:strand:+ start:41 stop:550 length:510 start_codon:yes stop_codon:yes gene_type:complete